MRANQHIYTCILAVGVVRIPEIAAAVSVVLPRAIHSYQRRVAPLNQYTILTLTKIMVFP